LICSIICFFSFSAPVSRGARKGEWGLLASAKGCLFAGEPRTSLFDLFLGGTANPEGVRQRTDKAEARRAASAQAVFPSRRAREKAVAEKDNGMTRREARQLERATNSK